MCLDLICLRHYSAVDIVSVRLGAGLGERKSSSRNTEMDVCLVIGHVADQRKERKSELGC